MAANVLYLAYGTSVLPDFKCVMFGVTHVLAIDGYSRKIVGFITIPKKNPIVIYDVLFRPLLQTEGMWEQVRVDRGTEFTLLITAQLHAPGSF